VRAVLLKGDGKGGTRATLWQKHLYGHPSKGKIREGGKKTGSTNHPAYRRRENAERTE